jgi:hypothetical protein
MTDAENIQAVLAGEILDVIPGYREVPMDVTALKSFLPVETGDPVKDMINFANTFDNSVCTVGLIVDRETLSKDESHHTYRYETGAVWHESYSPTFCREAIEFPINAPADAVAYTMDEIRTVENCDLVQLKDSVDAYHDAGFFVEGGVVGAWQSIYYYLTSFENILTWMAVESEAAKSLFDATTAYSLKTAEALLRCGVNSVTAPSDFGSGSSLLFSPELFELYAWPWLKKMADLCHSYGSYFHLHSHGHIGRLMDMIVRAGVDLINPVGPSDHNDLAEFKANWGDSISILGGISTTISTMTEPEMRSHVSSVIDTGRKGGRFFPRTESGIPPMNEDSVRRFLDTVRKHRLQGYV